MNLLELSEREQLWLEALTHEDEDGNPITDEEQNRVIDEYVAADAEFKNKLDRYVELSEGFAARASFREDRAAHIAELARRDNSVASKLRDRIKFVMTSRGEKKIETDFHVVTVCKNGGKAPLIAPDEWRHAPANAPEKYHRRRIELDLNALRSDLEAGESVDGCAIGERGTHLRIK